MEKLEYLINYLIQENKEIKINSIPEKIEDKKMLYRSLCNIREAKPIKEEYIKIENEFLQEETKTKGIIDEKNIKSNFIYNDTKISIWKGDITTLKIQAIVNAANSQGLGCFVPCHKCIDNQIGTFAGVSLRIECNEIMKKKNYNLKTGEAIITNGYNLPAEKIIHTVGPIIYDQVTNIEQKQLANCYINSLKLAQENNIKTIAFPCISTGEFRFPKDFASKIAIETVKEYLRQNNFEKIIFNVFSDEDYELYSKNLERIFKEENNGRI